MKFHNHASNTTILFCSVLILLLAALTSSAQNAASPPPGSCGGDYLCHDRLCCSKQGFCGLTAAYCAPENCQSQCWGSVPPPPSSPSPPPPSLPPPPRPTSPPPPSPPPPSPTSPPPPSLPPPPPPTSPPPPSPPPPSPSSPPPSYLKCGIDYECEDEDTCCSLLGVCFKHGSGWCEPEVCRSNCNKPAHCGKKGGDYCGVAYCCTTAGQCAPKSSLACLEICETNCGLFPPLINSS